jgi:hypothetical protein
VSDGGADGGGDPAVRRATLLCVGTSVSALAALAVLFGAVLEPVDTGGCSTSPAPGAYRDALVPAHVVAAAAIGAGVLELRRRRGGSGVRRARWALGAAASAAAIFVVWPGLFGPVAMVAMVAAVALGPVLALALAARTGFLLRRDARRATAWDDHARSAELLGWAALLVGVPASFGFAWVNAASLFCF